MTKQAEIDYFGKMDDNARRYAGGKPFTSDRCGAYLLDMGQILSLIRRPPTRMLDLGCGSGWTTAMFARSGYDFEALPFRGCFDIAVLYDCLHHAEHEHAVLRSAFGALDKGDEVILVEPGRGHHDSSGAQQARQAHGVTEKDMHPALTTRLLAAAGFSEIQVFPRAQFQIVERNGIRRRVKGRVPMMRRSIAAVSTCLLLGLLADGRAAAPADTIFDEARVPAYTLPDPLKMRDGTPVADAAAWRTRRRPEVLRLFEDHVYGRSPAPRGPGAVEVFETDPRALGGRATRKQMTVFLTGDRNGPSMDLLLYTPNAATSPAPAFLGLNFHGNHTVHADPGIRLSTRWMRQVNDKGIVSNRATEASRGCESSRWPVERIVGRGYALATVYYGDIEPDHAGGWKTGLRGALAPEGTNTTFRPGDWGAIGAWAWGLSRALDGLDAMPAVDARRVAVMGHSRLGKTALWAGARDERFAIVISNNSGEGGASIVRRRFGEALHHSVDMVPYWYCGRYRDYAMREGDLPVDAHLLIALAAPRPVYVASASEDLWADPRGEFLAAQNAEPVYRLFGRAGLGTDAMPPPDRSVGGVIGYHVRTGAHDVTAFDWEQYLAFADRHLGRVR